MSLLFLKTHSTSKLHYASLQQMRVFGETDEPHELARCERHRTRITYCTAIQWKWRSLKPPSFSFSENSSKNIKLLDEIKQLSTVSTRTWPILIKAKNLFEIERVNIASLKSKTRIETLLQEGFFVGRDFIWFSKSEM